MLELSSYDENQKHPSQSIADLAFVAMEFTPSAFPTASFFSPKPFRLWRGLIFLNCQRAAQLLRVAALSLIGSSYTPCFKAQAP
jgi:hypothetical protein